MIEPAATSIDPHVHRGIQITAIKIHDRLLAITAPGDGRTSTAEVAPPLEGVITAIKATEREKWTAPPVGQEITDQDTTGR